MKKYIILFFSIILFFGCAGKTYTDRSVVKSSKPIFIKNAPNNNSAYVNFTNTSSVDSNLTQAVSLNLAKNGYEIVSDKSEASTKIRGNLNFFRRNYIKDIDPFVVSGINFRYFGYDRLDALDDYYSSVTNSYVYDAEISLQINIDGEIYETNLYFQSDKNINSTSTMMEILNTKISNQILNYLKFLN